MVEAIKVHPGLPVLPADISFILAINGGGDSPGKRPPH
jgi:hypothetical protein